MVKNYRRKKTQCVLEINENRIILSNPQIQPFNSYRYESANDILYFYYDLEIQYDKNYWKQNICEDEEKKPKKKWIEVAAGNVYEFGAIVALEECIDKIISIDMKEKKDRVYYYEDPDGKELSETDYEVSHAISCTGMLEEDSYVLKKYLRHSENYYGTETESEDMEWYGVYIGIGNESRGNTVGFSCNNLAEDDLLTIKAWAKDFMELAKKVTKKQIKKLFKGQDGNFYHDTKWFKQHMKTAYPEDYGKWKEIWIELYEESFILEEYFNYVKGNPIEEPLFSKWEGDPVVAQKLIKTGMKDWEAYLKMIRFYHEANRELHKINSEAVEDQMKGQE